MELGKEPPIFYNRGKRIGVEMQLFSKVKCLPIEKGGKSFGTIV